MRVIVNDVSPDIVCIVETWSNDSLTDSYFKIDGYSTAARRDRCDTQGGVGGGLLILVRDDIKCIDNALPLYKDFNQCCAISVPVRGARFIELVLVYRPHNLYSGDDIAVNNLNLCNVVKNAPKPCLVLGDFNCSDISWENMTARNVWSKNILDCVQNEFFSQHVNFSTRAQSGTMPDVVLSSQSNLVLGVQDLPPLGASDHSMLLIDVAASPQRTSSCELIPDWAKADIPNLRKRLNEVDWREEFDGLSTDSMWDKFKEKLSQAQDEFVPKKTRRSGSRPIWMTRSVMRIIRKKRRLWKVGTTTSDGQAYLNYKEVERTVRKAVRNAKRNFERKLAVNAKKDPKAFYTYLKTKSSNRENVGPLKDGKSFVSEEEKMVEMLNGFFTSVFTQENTEGMPDPPRMFTGTSPLIDADITEEKIIGKIKNLKPSSAPGPDGITPKILQSVADIIASPLALLFKQSLADGVVPSDWRQANVTPIFKKGAKSNVGNYRPISLTSIICKIMESLLRDGITAHLHAHNVINASQHGFMSKRSCVSNLLQYLETITKLVDEGNCVDVIYLDFAKAFDKVPHERLLAKI